MSASKRVVSDAMLVSSSSTTRVWAPALGGQVGDHRRGGGKPRLDGGRADVTPKGSVADIDLGLEDDVESQAARCAHRLQQAGVGGRLVRSGATVEEVMLAMYQKGTSATWLVPVVRRSVSERLAEGAP